ncbi:hypothetical protein EDB83DRAFT_2316369 [Lactarius deliciosus]|nr:hypothetical protein EDB83DRAFT_2316369 [Lactarius deliciosus]
MPYWERIGNGLGRDQASWQTLPVPQPTMTTNDNTSPRAKQAINRCCHTNASPTGGGTPNNSYRTCSKSNSKAAGTFNHSSNSERLDNVNNVNNGNNGNDGGGGGSNHNDSDSDDTTDNGDMTDNGNMTDNGDTTDNDGNTTGPGNDGDDMTDDGGGAMMTQQAW